jgi:hypothetical protein
VRKEAKLGGISQKGDNESEIAQLGSTRIRAEFAQHGCTSNVVDSLVRRRILLPAVGECLKRKFAHELEPDMEENEIDLNVEEWEDNPPELVRASSVEYGPGASQYTEDTMRRWIYFGKVGKAAMDHAKATPEPRKAEEYSKAVAAFREAAALRPDHAQTLKFMELASKRLGAEQETIVVVCDDLEGEMIESSNNSTLDTCCQHHAPVSASTDEESELMHGASLLDWSLRQKRVNEHERIAVSRITPELFLGSRFGILDGETLLLDALQHKVMSWSGCPLTAIVNVASSDCQYTMPPECAYLPMAVKDHLDAPLLPLLDEAVDFIHAHVSAGGACFVHCMGGYSRSASVVIAYLMKHRALCYDDAHKVAIKGRPQVKPNDGFVKQLREFERKCCAK